MLIGGKLQGQGPWLVALLAGTALSFSWLRPAAESPRDSSRTARVASQAPPPPSAPGGSLLDWAPPQAAWWDAPVVSRDGSFMVSVRDLPPHPREWPMTAIYGLDTSERTNLSLEMNSLGQPGNSKGPHSPAVTPDGRYVAFASPADNLDPVTPDKNHATDIFRHDRRTGTTLRVSLADGGLAEGEYLQGSSAPSLSADGNQVAYASKLPWRRDRTHPVQQIYVRDIAGRTTRCVSLSSSGAPANDRCENAQLSGDGRYVLFESLATNLVTAKDTARSEDIFLRDRRRGQTWCLSLSRQGRPGSGCCSDASMTPDGRYVTFTSTSTHLVQGAAGTHIYVRDRVTGRITVESAGIDPTGNVSCSRPRLSEDGQYLIFSWSPFQPATNKFGPSQVVLRDRRTARMRVLQPNAAYHEGLGSLSGDGRWCLVAAWGPPDARGLSPQGLYRLPNPFLPPPGQ